MVPYVDAAVAVTVIHVLLFVLHVCILREGEATIADYSDSLISLIWKPDLHVSTHKSSP